MRIQRGGTYNTVKATSSAAIASAETAGGRLIPLIMIDADAYPEIREVIRAHEFIVSGDCVSQWATIIGDPDKVILHLAFERPIETSFDMEFELPKLAGAVDNIIRSKSMFLLEGSVGSTFTTTEGQPRILLEVPKGGFETTWDGVFEKSMARSFVAEGASRKDSRQLAKRFVNEWRANTTFHL